MCNILQDAVSLSFLKHTSCMLASIGYKQMEHCVQHISSDFLNRPNGNSTTCTSCTGDLLDIHLPGSEYMRQCWHAFKIKYMQIWTYLTCCCSVYLKLIVSVLTLVLIIIKCFKLCNKMLLCLSLG